jgi:poly(3-hydroxybutyrate) depolymerase
MLAILGERDEVVAQSAILDATKAWAHQDGCRPEPVGETVGWHIEHYEFQRCMDGSDVQLFMLNDMGHEWPKHSDDPRNAAWWADLMSATTVAITFGETFAR